MSTIDNPIPADDREAIEAGEDRVAGPGRPGLVRGAALVRLVFAVVFLALGALAALPAITSGYLFTVDNLTALGIASVAGGVVYVAGRWLPVSWCRALARWLSGGRS